MADMEQPDRGLIVIAAREHSEALLAARAELKANQSKIDACGGFVELNLLRDKFLIYGRPLVGDLLMADPAVRSGVLGQAEALVVQAELVQEGGGRVSAVLSGAQAAAEAVLERFRERQPRPLSVPAEASPNRASGPGSN